MRAEPICAACSVKDVINTVSRCNVKKVDEILKEVLPIIKEGIAKKKIPVEFGTEFHILIKNKLGKDPFYELKKQSNEVALRVSKKLESNIDFHGFSRLKFFIKASIVGNAFDFGAVGWQMDMRKFERFFFDEIKKKLANDDTERFYRMLPCSILYITDNTGEIVFDKLLIKELISIGCKVKVAVRGDAISNDATLEDAKFVSLTKVADVLTTGSRYMGVILSKVSNEFRIALNNADVIISKGQGNFETLSEQNINKPIFYLLKAKCPPNAKANGVNVGDYVARLENA